MKCLEGNHEENSFDCPQCNIQFCATCHGKSEDCPECGHPCDKIIVDCYYCGVGLVEKNIGSYMGRETIVCPECDASEYYVRP